MEQSMAILVEFDGTRYAGWQFQKNALSLQQVLQDKLTKICKHEISLTGCSRTDAGVHALGHVSNFTTRCAIPADRLAIAMNSLLPGDVSVLGAVNVDRTFNSRFHARRKRYSYRIWNNRTPSAIRSRFTCHIPGELDIEAMREGADQLVGEQDFRSFMAAGSSAKTTVRRLFSAKVWVNPEDRREIRFVVEGTGFLYNMMRIISGTLVYIGLGKIEPERMRDIIDARDRKMAGKTLPANGLFLEKVWFDEPLFFDETILDLGGLS
ncbi:MAG: tRNA pseudouridine(38-40) synthase TruA [Fastidiosipilaceae bacterium]|jgi:tRNA pseudouridine38-40 synthase